MARLAALLLASLLVMPPVPADAQASCSARAASLAQRPYTRVVSVEEVGGNRCRIRIVIERPGQLPRSRVVVVRR